MTAADLRRELGTALAFALAERAGWTRGRWDVAASRGQRLTDAETAAYAAALRAHADRCGALAARMFSDP